MFDNLHVCIDRNIPIEYDFLSQVNAGVAQERMAIVKHSQWPNGSILRCRFLDGSVTQRKKVEAQAHVWTQFANIKFHFVAQGDAELRISFKADPGSWSAVGTDALNSAYFPKVQPTMNFGWLKDDTEDAEYTRVVLHEFGHALGAIHEHQSPGVTFKWNKPKVYGYFEGPPNYWHKDDIDQNIFARYRKTQTNYTAFDPDSIMLYDFPAEFFIGGQATRQNNQLSNQDKVFMAKLYPKV